MMYRPWPCPVLFINRYWIVFYAVYVNFFVPVTHCQEMMEGMVSSGDSTIMCNTTCNNDYDYNITVSDMCQDRNGTGNETICMRKMVSDYNITASDMCQDGNGTGNETICMRSSSDDDVSVAVIAAVIAGVASLVVICIVIIILIRCYRRKKRHFTTLSIENDIPYTLSDSMVYYHANASASVKMQPNPSYNVNVNLCNKESCDHYEYVESPRSVENYIPSDDIYDNVNDGNEYLEVA